MITLDHIFLEVMSHSPFSPNSTSLDYHLLRALQYSLNGKIINVDNALKLHRFKFFADKIQNSITM